MLCGQASAKCWQWEEEGAQSPSSCVHVFPGVKIISIALIYTTDVLFVFLKNKTKKSNNAVNGVFSKSIQRAEI